MNATVAGVDAEINSRLWDMAPGGVATLVTRGAFRWTAGTSTITYSSMRLTLPKTASIFC